MYSPDALLATLAFVASLSGLICAAVFLILPRAVRRAITAERANPPCAPTT